jgi:hypothetical protein
MRSMVEGRRQAIAVAATAGAILGSDAGAGPLHRFATAFTQVDFTLSFNEAQTVGAPLLREDSMGGG